jgi:hypothetical protein
MVERPPDPSVPVDQRPLRRAWWIVVALVVVTIAAVVTIAISSSSRERPSFPILADDPDTSLHGTVAYLDGSSRCLWIVAAAGAPSRQVWCVPPMDVAKAIALGAKETDPQLRWLDDGRLEVTVFRAKMQPGLPPAFSAGWQRIVDVRTGAVEQVAADAVPPSPDLTTRPSVNDVGQRIVTESDPASGRITVRLRDDAGERTLLSVRGPAKYTYGLQAAFWAPGGDWILADDGRILVITTGDPPVTRILTDRMGPGGGMTDDGLFASFAVTDADLAG